MFCVILCNFHCLTKCSIVFPFQYQHNQIKNDVFLVKYFKKIFLQMYSATEKELRGHNGENSICWIITTIR